MAAAPNADFGAYLEGFLLRKYIASFRDPRRTGNEEDLAPRMEFESFLLGMGSGILARLQPALRLELEQPGGFPAVQWFVEFLCSRDRDWLARLQLDLVAHYWRIAPAERMRRQALELIAKAEWTQSPPDRQARFSEIVGLFKGVEPDPIREPLTEPGTEIVRFLLRRAECSPPSRLFAASLERYCLRVLTSCFLLENQSSLERRQVEAILAHAGNLTSEQRTLFDVFLAVNLK